MEKGDLYRLPANLHVHYTYHTALKMEIREDSILQLDVLWLLRICTKSHIRNVACLNKRPETTGQNFKFCMYQVNYVSGSMNALKLHFHKKNSTEKCLGCIHLIFERSPLKLHPQFLLQWAEQKNLCILMACLPAAAQSLATGAGQCSVSANLHGRNSRKSHLRWTPAAILLWLKANAFYRVGAPLLLFLVGIKLLWMSSAMVPEDTQENEQLLWPREEQSLQGALKCRCPSCCSSPQTAWWGMQLWKRQPPDTTDHV